ncbi:PQQ-dependent sugar dehydrogenase [Clostridium sardiniense]
MKRFFKFFICSIFIVGISLGIYAYSNRYGLNIIKEGVDSNLLIKGCEGATALVIGENSDIYMSLKNEIVKINKKNKIDKVYRDSNLNIQDMVYKDGNIYLLSNENFILIDSNGESKILKSGLPYGENMYRNLLVKNNSILISIGSRTNAGVAKEGEKKDISPINLELNGVNYGKENTGAFKDYGVKSSSGEKISGEEIGTASIIEFDINTGKYSLFASGIKSIKGYDINSRGEILATVCGIEESGERGAIRDTDYIYKITEGLWYGWPDFSGGDPITSPRFTNDKIIEPLIKNPPEKIGQTPSYQHSSVNSLGKLAIDKEGKLLCKDSIIFYDDKEKIIYSLDDKKILSKILELEEDSKIEDIVFRDNDCIFLDSGKGCVYRLIKNENIIGGSIPYGVAIFSLTIMIVALVIIISKIKRKK